MNFAIINESTLMTDPTHLPHIAGAVQRQLSDHVSNEWGRYAVVQEYHSRADVPDGHLVVAILDDADQAGALGYHDEVGGKAYARVFVRPVLELGGAILSGSTLTVSSVVSHEVLEALIDDTVNIWWQRPDGTLTAAELCMTGDTKVSMLDGTERRIDSLEDEAEFWVYGCTPDGMIVPARGHSARRTKTGAPIVEVELDNGETVRCTPDHRFMLRDGSYAEASSLEPGSSLMPLYRRRAKMESSTLDYEQVSHPATGEWTFTHRMVVPECPSGHVRHHKDFNRFNNAPQNLAIMRANEHIALHGHSVRQLWAEGRHGWQKPNPGKRARDSVRMAAYNKTKAHRDVASESGRANMNALWQRPDFREHHAKRGASLLGEYNASGKRAIDHARFLVDEDRRAAWAAKCTIANKCPAKRERSRVNAIAVQAARSPEEKSRLGKYAMHVRWHERRGVARAACAFCSEATAPRNHKVVAVRECGTSDVWDLTVDGVHNFALSSGVFVHNCDAVESDSYAVEHLDHIVMVSNFVMRGWIDSQNLDRQRDWMNTTPGPFEMSSGGYLITMTEGRVSLVYGAEFHSSTMRGYKMAAHGRDHGSRTRRRMRGR